MREGTGRAAAPAAPAGGLHRLLSPASVAVVGATDDPTTIGGRIFANLLRAFPGPLYPVHRRDAVVQGRRAYPSVVALPEPADLAVVVVPAAAVASVLDDCAARGVGGAVVITSGFAEAGPEGAALQERISRISRASALRVVGPNCIGFMNLFGGVMANFALQPDEALPAPGPVALVSQSGGFGSYMATKALLSGVRLGWFVSTGNESDVNIAEVSAYLAEREETRVLLLFSETLRNPDTFVEAARRAGELDKPVVLLKAGRTEAAAKAALSHTASIVGSAEVLDAVARQYGVFVVSSMEEMLDLGMIFQDGRRVRNNRVGIMTPSGGAGVLLADACSQAGLVVPELPPAERAELLDLMPKPFYGSVANPVDTTAQVVNEPGAYDKLLTAVGESESIDLLAPVTWAVANPTNDAIISFYRSSDRPVAVTSTAWLDVFQEAGVPTYTDPRRAANALGALYEFSMRAGRAPGPSGWRPDPDRLRRVAPLLQVPPGERTMLESAAKEVVAHYGVGVTREVLVADAEGAVRAAARLGGPVALKVMSYQLPHKTEAGAVRLGVHGADAVRAAHAELLERIGPHVTVAGVLVCEMVPARFELTCGMRRDPVFGPVVAVGLGGVLVEILHEAAVLRPPFDAPTAARVLAEVLDGRLVGGSRGLSPREQDTVARAMVGVGELALEFPEIAEVDLNPLRVADGSVWAADALIVLNA